jgi:hypothetical protein
MLDSHWSRAALLSAAIVGVDAVALFATILRALATHWGYPFWLQLASAGVAGLFGAALLTSGTARNWPMRAAWLAIACLTWTAAGAIGHWAENEAIFGPRVLPQWSYVTHTDAQGASGLTFFSGQAVAGAIAGIGLGVLGLFDRRVPLARRVTVLAILATVAALTWMATFHGRWVACGFGFSASESSLDIAPPAP